MKKAKKNKAKQFEPELRKHGFQNLNRGQIIQNMKTARLSIISVAITFPKVDPKILMANQPIAHRHSDMERTLMYALTFTESQKKKMKIINKSIEQLTRVLFAKGYTRPFYHSVYGTDYLPDLLTKISSDAVKNPSKNIFPCTVSTYSKFNTDDSAHINCAFTLVFSDKIGLNISHLKVTNRAVTDKDLDNQTIEEWNKPINGLINIPDRDLANKKVTPVEISKKKNKGLKH